MPLCLMHDAKAPSASGLIVFGSFNEAGTVFGEASGVLAGLFSCHSVVGLGIYWIFWSCVRREICC